MRGLNIMFRSLVVLVMIPILLFRLMMAMGKYLRDI